MRQILAVFSLALLSGCSTDAPTAARTPDRPSFLSYDASAPAPVLLSAVAVEDLSDTQGYVIRVSFVDVAEGERIVSAYCTSATASAATQNIEGTADASGERVADVILPDACAAGTLRLRYMWGTLPGDGSDIVWGPFSAAVAVTSDAVAVTTSTKKKGRK